MPEEWVSAWEQALRLATDSMASASLAQQATWTAATRYLELLSRSYARWWGQPAAANADRRQPAAASRPADERQPAAASRATGIGRLSLPGRE
jgi:hypothetical protein